MTISRYSFWICAACIVLSFALTVYIFAASRNDPGLRMAALVGGTNIATALMATASTLLTGKDLTSKPHDPNDLPPGSVQTEKTTIQTPPVSVSLDPTAQVVTPDAKG